MKKPMASRLLLVAFLTCSPMGLAQETPPSHDTAAQAAPVAADAQEKNIQEYTALLHANVRQQKSQLMATVMQLDPDDAAKFWPIYKEYDAELNKLNDLRVANIQKYTRDYDQMTEGEADQLIQKSLNYRNQRSALLAKYYGRVKASLGAVEAARFYQVEDQLLELMDLQMESILPIAGQGS